MKKIITSSIITITTLSSLGTANLSGANTISTKNLSVTSKLKEKQSVLHKQTIAAADVKFKEINIYKYLTKDYFTYKQGIAFKVEEDIVEGTITNQNGEIVGFTEYSGESEIYLRFSDINMNDTYTLATLDKEGNEKVGDCTKNVRDALGYSAIPEITTRTSSISGVLGSNKPVSIRNFYGDINDPDPGKIIGRSTTDFQGNYTLDFPRQWQYGDDLEVQGTTNDGTPVNIHVEIASDVPLEPVVNPVKSTDIIISGTADINTTIEVKDAAHPEKILGTTTTSGMSKAFYVTVPAGSLKDVKKLDIVSIYDKTIKTIQVNVEP